MKIKLIKNLRLRINGLKINNISKQSLDILLIFRIININYLISKLRLDIK